VLLAGAAGAGIVAADLGAGTDVLLDLGVMMMAVIAIGAVHMNRLVVMVAIGTMNVGLWGGGRAIRGVLGHVIDTLADTLSDYCANWPLRTVRQRLATRYQMAARRRYPLELMS
jgi:hypothetical protein